jgi:predicted ATP-grasp superfamily ATP-dependent carboligase
MSLEKKNEENFILDKKMKLIKYRLQKILYIHINILVNDKYRVSINDCPVKPALEKNNIVPPF